MDEVSLSRQEMSVYCKYLTGINADEQSLALFQRAIQHEETILNDEEIKLLQFMIGNPFSVGMIDSALGLFRPKHRLRKRMIIAFAILETSPVYFDYFKPKVFSRLHLITLIGKGLQEALQGLAGSIILLFY
jgi:hypothetical protein